MLNEHLRVQEGQPMKLLCTAICVAILFGCSTTAVDQNLSDEEKGKAALLVLMRSKDSPFEGADPKVFEKIKLKSRGGDEFQWGAFVISPGTKTYSAQILGPGCNWFFHGRFTVE